MKLIICEVYGKIFEYTISSESEAIKITQNFIEERGLGGSSFGFAFIIKNNKLFKCISYNGKIWTPEQISKDIGEASWYRKQMKKYL